MTTRRNVLAFVALGAFLSLPSGAAATTFDFNGANANLGTTESFTIDGIQVDVYGFSYARVFAGVGNPVNTWYAADIRLQSNALAIDHANTFPDIVGTELDNLGWYDLIVFALPVNVAPVSVGFSAMDADDDWIVGWANSLLAPSGTPAAFFGGLTTSTGDSSSFTFPGPLDPTKRYIYIGGQNLTNVLGNDDFRVTSLEVAAVPEPGTLLLIGSGLTGLALRRRRPRA